jgi:four helix bundle protein
MNEQTNKFILDLSYSFALKIVSFSEEMEKSRDYEEEGELFKSGTAIGARIREAQASESSEGFLYNLSCAVIEAEETETRLRQYRNKGIYPDAINLLNDILVLKRFLKDIIDTTRRKQLQNEKMTNM